MDYPPVKPPRGVKPVKETSGLLMSVIRTLSSSETNEQRDREKAKLETEYKNCDKRLDELVSKHEDDLTKIMNLFGTVSQIVSENRTRIATVKENLQDCKKKLHCKRDELKNLWLEGLEYKYMLELLEKIEKMNLLPNRLANYMSHKQYLHATKLLVEAVSLGKDTLEGVESLKELSQELEQKKEQLHLQLLVELKQHLFIKPAQHIISLRRQGSGRDSFNINSPLQRSIEMRRSFRNNVTNIAKDLFPTYLINEDKNVSFDVEEDLTTADPEENPTHFMAILIECLALLNKLPFAVNEIKQEMQQSLLSVVDRTTQNVKDFLGIQNGIELKIALKDLMQILFDQFKQISDTQINFLKNIEKTANNHKIPLKIYNIQYYWVQVQIVLESLLNDYLDIPNMSTIIQINDTNDTNDLSSYFSRRKQQIKKKSLFKFDCSTSALTLTNSMQSTKKDKILVCPPHPNNILTIFIIFICFIEEMELLMEVKHGSSQLFYFLSDYVSNNYLKRKSEEVMNQVEVSVRASDAWKAVVLLDNTSDYKPLLISTVAVERCVREWRTILRALPLYSEKIVEYSYKALKEYKDTCYAAYQGIVQPHSEDRRICSAAWLKDEDISRFLKSLPNWLNLKAQQEYQARSERSNNKKLLKRAQPSEEESPEDIRERNRREAEILAGNLGEGGVGSGEILSDMGLLKELAQLQESMEWFAVRMFQFTSEFRHDPIGIGEGDSSNLCPPVSAVILQQLTSISQEFDELANTCLLLLHLEVRVQCFHYLLAQTYYNKQTHEPDPKVLELSRVLANVDEAMTSSLHPRKCKYIFEGLGHLIAKILISSAQYMHRIDETGIQRMCRNIFTLQQTLTNITMNREVSLDHARHYYELFFLEPKEVLNNIVEKRAEFTELEYMNALQLLHRSKTGAYGSVNDDIKKLSDILGGIGIRL